MVLISITPESFNGMKAFQHLYLLGSIQAADFADCTGTTGCSCGCAVRPGALANFLSACVLVRTTGGSSTPHQRSYNQQKGAMPCPSSRTLRPSGKFSYPGPW